MQQRALFEAIFSVPMWSTWTFPHGINALACTYLFNKPGWRFRG